MLIVHVGNVFPQRKNLGTGKSKRGERRFPGLGAGRGDQHQNILCFAFAPPALPAPPCEDQKLSLGEITVKAVTSLEMPQLVKNNACASWGGSVGAGRVRGARRVAVKPAVLAQGVSRENELSG